MFFTSNKEDFVFEQIIDLSSCNVSNVTVFKKCAEIQRILETSLVPIGVGCITIRDFPITCLMETLRIGLSSKYNKILEVHVFDGEEKQREKRKSLELTLKTFKNQMKINRIKYNNLVKHIEMLATYISQIKEIPKNLSLKDSSLIKTINHQTKVKKIMDLYTKEIIDIKKQIGVLQDEYSDIENNIKKTTNLLSKCIESPLTQEVEVIIYAEKETNISLNISYFNTAASWEPSYDFRIFSKTKKTELTYYGIIKQNSSSDWKGAKISLSTASPAVNSNPPRIKLTYIERNNNGNDFNTNINTVISTSSSIEDKNQITKSTLRTTKSPKKHISSLPSSSSQLQSIVYFIIPRKSANIRTGNIPCKVTIGTIPLVGEFRYTTVPVVMEKAFLRIIALNSSEYPVLCGPCSIFYDNAFVSSIELGNVNTGEQFDIFVGVDDSLLIKYDKKLQSSEISGFISKISTQHYETLSEVHNTKSSEVTVKIIDQFPITNEEKVKIKLQQPDIKNKNVSFNNRTNKLEYTCTIKPEKKEVLHVIYSIEFPKDKQIQQTSGPYHIDNTSLLTIQE